MMVHGASGGLYSSDLIVKPHLPHTFLSLCSPRKTPGPHSGWGQGIPFLTSSPSTISYFDGLDFFHFSPEPAIKHHLPRTLLVQILLPQEGCFPLFQS